MSLAPILSFFKKISKEINFFFPPFFLIFLLYEGFGMITVWNIVKAAK